jgi:hypothetical protein
MSKRDDDPLGLFTEVPEHPLPPGEKRLYDYLASLDEMYGAQPGSMHATRRRYVPMMVYRRWHPDFAKLYYRGLIATDAACEALQAEIDAAQNLPPFDWRTDPLPE